MSDLRNKLRNYSPPESVWEAITEDLSPLHGLNYTPPETVWSGIEEELSPVLALDKHTIPTSVFWKWGGYAAAATFLLAGISWFLLHQTQPEIITYSTEKNTIQMPLQMSDNVEKKYEQIQQICLKRVEICEKPEFKQLKRELDDLTTASNQLKEVIGQYNTDKILTLQLADIELERCEILKKLEQRI